LIGINNQNFLMEDLETRSWWQQVSGVAISGPLKGEHLDPVVHDEITYGLWQREYPTGRVLALVNEDDQIDVDWESKLQQVKTVVPAQPGDTLALRDVVIGVTVEGQAKAYPQTLLRKTRALMDRVGTTPVAVLIGADDHSARVFDRRIDGGTDGVTELELMARVGVSPAVFVDTQTGSEWDISGVARSGPLAGRTLRRLPQLTDYWFDWHLYHPDTRVYREWTPKPSAPPPQPVAESRR
jgi:hypothetical protein